MADASAAPPAALSKFRALSENKVLRIVTFTIGVTLTIIVGILVILQLFAYLAYCGFYGQYDRKNTKETAVPAEVFFTTICVIVVGVLSFAATLFCSIVALVDKGPSTMRNIFLVISLVVQCVTVGVLVVQSANYGGQARILQKLFDNLCPYELTDKYKKNCWGMVNSLWAIFAACLMLLFSSMLNTVYTVFVLLIKG